MPFCESISLPASEGFRAKVHVQVVNILKGKSLSCKETNADWQAAELASSEQQKKEVYILSTALWHCQPTSKLLQF